MNDNQPNLDLHESAVLWDELMALYRRWRLIVAGPEDVARRFGMVAELAATEVERGDP